MNFLHSFIFSGVYYFKFYLGALQSRWFYFDSGGLAIMVAGHDPCRKLLIIFPGGSNCILHVLHFIFLVFPLPFSFNFSSLFSEKDFLFYSNNHLTKQSTWCIKHVGCPFSFKNQGKCRVLSFLLSLPCLLS